MPVTQGANKENGRIDALQRPAESLAMMPQIVAVPLALDLHDICS